MVQQFWLNKPSVLLNRKYIAELWPNKEASLEQKLNSITRVVILLSIVGYVVTRNVNIVLISVATLLSIIFFYRMQHDKHRVVNKKVKEAMEEGFTNPELYTATKEMFTPPTKKNPLMNVMLPEIQDNPERKPAAPSFNPKVEEEINESVKKDLDVRLFKDLGDNIEFEGSMRGFYSTANTQIPNDQKAFAEFCYGGMKSCKEGDGIQCEKKNYRYINR